MKSVYLLREAVTVFCLNASLIISVPSACSENCANLSTLDKLKESLHVFEC